MHSVVPRAQPALSEVRPKNASQQRLDQVSAPDVARIKSSAIIIQFHLRVLISTLIV